MEQCGRASDRPYSELEIINNNINYKTVVDSKSDIYDIAVDILNTTLHLQADNRVPISIFVNSEYTPKIYLDSSDNICSAIGAMNISINVCPLTGIAYMTNISVFKNLWTRSFRYIFPNNDLYRWTVGERLLGGYLKRTNYPFSINLKRKKLTESGPYSTTAVWDVIINDIRCDDCPITIVFTNMMGNAFYYMHLPKVIGDDVDIIGKDKAIDLSRIEVEKIIAEHSDLFYKVYSKEIVYKQIAFIDSMKTEPVYNTPLKDYDYRLFYKIVFSIFKSAATRENNIGERGSRLWGVITLYVDTKDGSIYRNKLYKIDE